MCYFIAVPPADQFSLKKTDGIDAYKVLRKDGKKYFGLYRGGKWFRNRMKGKLVGEEGVYSFADLNSALNYHDSRSGFFAGDALVIVKVRIWGDVISYKKCKNPGYRSTHAQILGEVA